MKRIFIKEEVCIGCRLCEIYCIVEHSNPKDILKSFKKGRSRTLPRIIVEERGNIAFALQCRHCEDPFCLEACISGALYRDNNTGAILLNKDKCVGCWMCIMVCPFGAIQRESNHKMISSKCDLCIGREIPVCVERCPNQALFLKDV